MADQPPATVCDTQATRRPWGVLTSLPGLGGWYVTLVMSHWWNTPCVFFRCCWSARTTSHFLASHSLGNASPDARIIRAGMCRLQRCGWAGGGQTYTFPTGTEHQGVLRYSGGYWVSCEESSSPDLWSVLIYCVTAFKNFLAKNHSLLHFFIIFKIFTMRTYCLYCIISKKVHFKNPCRNFSKPLLDQV